MRFFLAVTVVASALMTGGGSASAGEPIREDVAAVRSLYKAFAWEAVLDEPGPERTLAVQPRAALLKYFTPELSELFLQDRQCIARTQGICNLDFMPLWDSQDPSSATVTMTGEPNPGEVLVQVRYPPGEVRKLHFRLARGPAGWKIADIVYEGRDPAQGAFSLTRLLVTPVEGDSPAK